MLLWQIIVFKCINETDEGEGVELVDSSTGKTALFPPSVANVRVWFGLSVLISVVFSSIALFHSFGSEYMIQDDARHHVFWMHRFADSTLFPNDLIADYFQSVAPLGYVWLYRLFAVVHIDPITLNKLLPFGLGLIMTVYCFGVSMELLPMPMAGFVSSLLLNELIWAEDNLISATPRAFVYPIFLGFLYYFMRRSLWPCLLLILLQGLFYPQYALIIIAFLLIFLIAHRHYFVQTGFKLGKPFGLRFWKWTVALPQGAIARKDLCLCVSGVGLACGILLLFKLTSGGFGPVVSFAEAKQMIEFTNAGRFPFFDDNPLCFWLSKKNSGLLAAYNATHECELYVGPFPFGFPPLLWASFLLPLMVGFKSVFPELFHHRQSLKILGYVFIASLLLFFIAHAVLLTLHLPARYTVHSFRILMALAAGITLTLISRKLLHRVSENGEKRKQRSRWKLGLASLFLVLVGTFPFLTVNFATKALIQGKESGLYQFMAAQPRDILVASISSEADNIPTFSQRSVLVNRENAIPFHHGFYDEFSQRAHDVLEAQYTKRFKTLKTVIQNYDVDFWLIDDDAFESSYLEKHWVQQYQPTFRQARRQLLQDSRSTLEKIGSKCIAFKGDRVTVIDAKCIVQSR